MTSTCWAAFGWMSRKATNRSSSSTIPAGMLPSAILQNMQSSMGPDYTTNQAVLLRDLTDHAANPVNSGALSRLARREIAPADAPLRIGR